METATSLAIQPALAPGTLTVGTHIEVDHLKAAPAGVTVVAKATLVEINGRRLIFEVEAKSGDALIGRGRIFRAIVRSRALYEYYCRKTYLVINRPASLASEVVFVAPAFRREGV